MWLDLGQWFSQEYAEGYCMDYAEGAVGLAMDTCMGMVANAGQESIVADAIGDFADQVESIAFGEFSPVSSSHDEAVGEIMEAGNEICEYAANHCAEVMAGADAG